jgi:transcriptional regulator with XRE-family HTH domain
MRSMTQASVARALGEAGYPLAPSSVAMVERGEYDIHVRTLIAFSHVYRVDPGVLLDRWWRRKMLKLARATGPVDSAPVKASRECTPA